MRDGFQAILWNIGSGARMLRRPLIVKANMRMGRNLQSVRLNAGNVRSDSGIYLVELLVAVFISSLLAAALAENMSQTLKLTSSGQNQIVAAAIGQELIDNARNTDYAVLSGLVGNTYTLNINSSNSGSPVNTRPLMLDLTNLDWSTDAENNKFVGTVTEMLTNAGWGSYTDATGAVLPNGVKVDITVNWTEIKMNKTYTVSTFISRNGIHN